MEDDLRSELADLVRAVHAYVAWHGDTGSVGFPRSASRLPPIREDGDNAAPVHAATTPRPMDSPLAGPPVAPFSPTLFDEPVPVPRVAKAKVPLPPPPPPGESRDRHVHLPRIETDVKSCTKCRLHETRTNTVFARGNPDAPLVFVGEGPGADEDATGKPFVGRAGQLLDKMIGAMGLDPGRDVYICNIVKCRPPGNRRPEPDEVASCIPYLHEQLDLVAPKVIVALGNTALAALLGTSMPITKVRGTWKLYRGTTMLMPTYHPSFLLRPTSNLAESKRQAWEDLQAVMKELGLAIPQKR
jgi:uracil-DNA glycosylase family 4